ncbi:hypothetical protein B0T18DRAFT_107188 [Schizothecium vesticola]|uniref:Uncharacterized protein n=1 Tax=Schizothecium vesticola TaxID=314040 RepID=A0AA40K836_9PEZI|nr:hypothetical protein B0T18DRAFT_107188 [Schizothecium vesticola]
MLRARRRLKAWDDMILSGRDGLGLRTLSSCPSTKAASTKCSINGGYLTVADRK